MVEVDQVLHDFAQTILSEFDPERARQAKIDTLGKALGQAEATEELQKASGDLSVKANAEKWSNAVKKMDLEDELEEAKQTDYEQ